MYRDDERKSNVNPKSIEAANSYIYFSDFRAAGVHRQTTTQLLSISKPASKCNRTLFVSMPAPTPCTAATPCRFAVHAPFSHTTHRFQRNQTFYGFKNHALRFLPVAVHSLGKPATLATWPPMAPTARAPLDRCCLSQPPIG